ncbi:MAG: hypothetical protein H7X97_04765 [Opitutaceae bacterium]|nr:hypothetical protein [Verrucomicrobiales bacterium]
MKEMQVKYPFLTVIKEESMPSQLPESYQDLTHVTAETQARFTRYVGDLLEQIASTTARNPQSINGPE